MTRFLGYGILGLLVAATGYSIGLSVPELVIGLCLAYILVSIIEWRVT